MTVGMVWHFIALVIDVLLIAVSENKYVKILAAIALVCMATCLCGDFGFVPVS